MPPAVSEGAVEGADRKSATETASPTPAIKSTFILEGVFFILKWFFQINSKK